MYNGTIDYGYDDLHRLGSAAYAQGTPHTSGTETFAMDRLSNRQTYGDTRDNQSVGYSANTPANEYVNLGRDKAAYDAAGNLVRRDRLGDMNCDGVLNNSDVEPFQLAMQGREPYEQQYPNCIWLLGDFNADGTVNNFDLDPFVIALTSGDRRRARHYVYDEQNRLALVTKIDGQAVLEVDYDALGRRIRTITYDDAGPVSDVVHYYDGQRVLADFAFDTGQLRRYYVDGPLYVDEHVLLYDQAGGADRYYLLGELYSVVGVVDAAGSLQEAYAYDGYGGVRLFDTSGGPPTAIPASGLGNPYYFTGRWLDAMPNPLTDPYVYDQLYHYRARTYDPPHGLALLARVCYPCPGAA